MRAIRMTCLMLAVVLPSVGSFAADVQASSVCVVCQQPDATYSCSGPDRLDTVRSSIAKRALGFSCVQDIAHTYGHGSCSVRLDEQMPCLGTPHALLKRDQIEALAASPYGPEPAAPSRPGSDGVESGDAGAEAEPAATATPKQEKREPETVAELAKQTADASKRQLKEAQDAIRETARNVSDGVSGAAKTSWRCLSSFFTDCW